MLYDLIEFSDGVQAIREINANGHVTRYCDADGMDIGRLYEQVNIIGTAAPAWALPDPVAEQPAPYVPPARRLTKLAFVGRLGSDFIGILMASKVNVDVEMFVKMLDWATPDPDGTSVDLDDPRVVYALNMLEASGVIAAGRATEILNA
jgi:hypothetical protein